MDMSGTNKRYVYLAAALAGLAGLYTLGCYVQPPQVSITDVQEHEGETVSVVGRVVDAYQAGEASIITICRGDARLMVFVPGGCAVHYGDRVEVEGTVQRYQGRWEIAADRVETLRSWDAVSIPLWELASHYDDYVDTNVNVTGYISRLYESSFYLTDVQQQYSVQVRHPRSMNLSARRHDQVAVRARLTYTPDTMSLYLDICEEAHGITVLG
ncbi:MAG: hypothetical protein PHU95_03245 [Candidatus Thermoplasmatota archaeon]|nr:hypothetical protein [Candidatus Thermoplasmatota archaeon]